MISQELIAYIFTRAPFLIAKILVIILLLVHLVFSLVVVRQTKMMIKVVEAKISSVIYSISLLHLFASLFVLVWTTIFL